MRRLLWWALSVCGLVVLAGCDGQPSLAGAQEEGDAGEQVEVLTVSSTWQAGADAALAADRIAALTEAVNDLRSATGSGWVGRQDDVTGYLGELRGGRYESPDGGGPSDTAAAFLDQWGPELFGVGAQGVDFTPQGAPDPSGSVVLRGLQHVAEVPVVDGVLTVTIADAQSRPRISALRGRVFGGLDVSTTPTLDASGAAGAALGGGRAAGGGEVQGDPSLVVYPAADQGAGALAWEVTVIGAGPAGGQDDGGFEVTLVYVDAGDGTIIATRPASFDQMGGSSGGRGLARCGASSTGCRAPAALGPVAGRGGLAQTDEQVLQGEPVEVSGEGPLGDELTATGLQTDDGTVALVDPTTDSYDPSTGQGAAVTHDGTGLEDADLPGPTSTFESTQVTDSEALAGHALARYVLDYYAQVFGRNSWDGAGGSLHSVVNFGPPDFCNAFFSGSTQPPVMVYGNPCTLGGEQVWESELDVDVAGHEITHGVTSTSSNLLYTGQSGALNESFSDYFGNVIGDHWRDRDTTAVGEGQCEPLENPQPPFCVTNDEGDIGFRDLLNGAGLSDYLYLLDPPLSVAVLGFGNDHGGVHGNSAIWNNALVSIRTRLAQIDGENGRESVRAHNFDQAVYATLTQRLGPTSGFLEAAAALEESAIELGLDPESVEVIRETMVLNDICAGCADPDQVVGDAVEVSAATQKTPVAGGERLAWMEFTGDEIAGVVGYGTADGPEGVVATGGPAYAVGFAGDTLVVLEDDEEAQTELIVGYDLESGDREVLSEAPYFAHFIGMGSSAEGAAWIDLAAAEVSHVDAQGSIDTASLDDAGLSGVASMGAGGGTVAVGGERGEVVAWQPGSEPELLDTLGAPVVSIDAQGSWVLAVAYDGQSGTATLYDLGTGDATVLSESAEAAGAALSDDVAVWSEIVGVLGGAVAEQSGATLSDTDLYSYDLASGETVALVEQRGQQGFPEVAGDRLVWQDAVNGGDDIYTMELP